MNAFSFLAFKLINVFMYTFKIFAVLKNLKKKQTMHILGVLDEH